jgi:hypothetical protein
MSTYLHFLPNQGFNASCIVCVCVLVCVLYHLPPWLPYFIMMILDNFDIIFVYVFFLGMFMSTVYGLSY